MSKKISYSAAGLPLPSRDVDPYLRPAFSLRNRIKRLLWNFCWLLLFRPSLRPMYAWRAMLLKAFGAELGPNCKFYPKSKIWAPWNLTCADLVAVGDDVEIYNPAPMHLGSHAIVSQGAYLCGASHDYDDPAFPLLAFSMSVGAYAWIAARASVCPGVNVGEGAVLALGAVASRDLEPWGVYAGSPAVKLKIRSITGGVSF